MATVFNRFIKRGGFATLFGVFVLPSVALALPFNDDMVHSQKNNGSHMYYATGQLMRERPEGVVGMSEQAMNDSNKTKEEYASNLQNPIKGDAKSIPVGQRLFQINCSPCHGNIESDPYQRGPVAEKFAAPPDITQEPYRTVRNDGYIYGVINTGGLAVMPPLGWKLSPTEHWEIINYIRHVQSQKAKAGK